ncbi:MAG TPA: acyl-CoA dehydrogenase family protein [Solirubrobacterales bacterium]
MTVETEAPAGPLPRIEALAGELVAAEAAAIDRERRFPAESIEALAQAGALGLTVPTEHGGAGAGLGELAAACEAIGGACASTGMVFLMHSVAAATVAGGGGERAGELAERMAAGALGTLAFSERGTGAHFYSPELRAERVDGDLRISGRKSFVTSGGRAAVYLVLVGAEEGEGADCYAIEADRAGLSFEGAWEGLGMAGNSSVAMVLDGVEVGDADRIGEPGAGGELVFGVVAPVFLVGLAAVNVGIAAAAEAAAIEHVKGRSYPDGSTLAELQAIQHALADIDLATGQARLAVREAARLGEAGEEGALVAIMEAKIAATEAAAAVTQRALETCGGQAYGPGLPIERHLRDARAGAVMAPTNAVLRNWIGRALAGLPVP